MDLNHLYLRKEGKSRRVSSWDETGGNMDRKTVKPGERLTLADIQGSGIIQHIWITTNSIDVFSFRKMIFSIYWDQEKHPSVNSPIGDFFGVGHGVANHYMSLPLNMIAPLNTVSTHAAMNCFFEMPFSDGARIVLLNECEHEVMVYYYIDYVERSIPDDAFRFHAMWKRQITDGVVDLVELRKVHERQDEPNYGMDKVSELVNLNVSKNYVLLEAEGEGHFVGCNLSVDNINPVPGNSWFGEGDDMFIIDGEPWPPRLHGTGTEDYFCAAWGYPPGKYDGHYHGVSFAAPLFRNEHAWNEKNRHNYNDYSGKWTTYRFHIVDPILFSKSIHFSIEHGHGNCQANDYSSVAYWYQKEPHQAFPEMISVENRLPLSTQVSLQKFAQSY